MSQSTPSSPTTRRHSTQRRLVAVFAALALSFLGLAIGPKAFAAANPYTINGNNMNGSLVAPDHVSMPREY